MPKIYGVFYRGTTDEVREWKLCARGVWPTLELAKAHLVVESCGSILEHAIFEMQRVELEEEEGGPGKMNLHRFIVSAFMLWMGVGYAISAALEMRAGRLFGGVVLGALAGAALAVVLEIHAAYRNLEGRSK